MRDDPGVPGPVRAAEEIMALSDSRSEARRQQGAAEELANAVVREYLIEGATGGLLAGVPLIAPRVGAFGRSLVRSASEVLEQFGGRAVRESATGLSDEVIARGRELARTTRSSDMDEGLAGARIEDALGVRLRSVPGTPSGQDFEILNEVGDIVGHIEVKGPRLRADGSVNTYHNVDDFARAVERGLRKEAANPQADVFVVDLGGFNASEQSRVLSDLSQRVADLDDDVRSRMVIIGVQE